MLLHAQSLNNVLTQGIPCQPSQLYSALHERCLKERGHRDGTLLSKNSWTVRVSSCRVWTSIHLLKFVQCFSWSVSSGGAWLFLSARTRNKHLPSVLLHNIISMFISGLNMHCSLRNRCQVLWLTHSITSCFARNLTLFNLNFMIPFPYFNRIWPIVPEYGQEAWHAIQVGIQDLLQDFWVNFSSWLETLNNTFTWETMNRTKLSNWIWCINFVAKSEFRKILQKTMSMSELHWSSIHLGSQILSLMLHFHLDHEYLESHTFQFVAVQDKNPHERWVISTWYKSVTTVLRVVKNQVQIPRFMYESGTTHKNHLWLVYK